MKLKPYTVIALDEANGLSLAEFLDAPSPQAAAILYAELHRDKDRYVVAVLEGEQSVVYPEGAYAEHVSDLAELADEEEGDDE